MFTRQQIADACRDHGPWLDSLPLPSGYDGARVLWAICGNESSFGANCTPRHEPAYDVGGKYATNPAQAALLEKFGSAGACSYGPMQVMLVNAPEGMTPDAFASVREGIFAGAFALRMLVRRNHPASLTQLAACYNAGHIPEVYPSGVLEYVKRLLLNYEEPLPAAQEIA